MNDKSVGISGFSFFTPHYHVRLEDWCQWTDNPWGKVRKVVGRGFRMPGPDEDVYTMAATAVLRLIDNYELNPADVGMLAFGTESSTDNAVGPVIIKGMVNDALAARGDALLPRDCEVPEYKQACLAGVYALKGALRYLRADGTGRQAIVVCGDIASYQRGSSGEQTQGAGAVAMLVEETPKLLSVDLSAGGSSSAYRGTDFRKPVKRYLSADFALGTAQVHDYPLFNGRYSTSCYIDATRQAFLSMCGRLGVDACDYLEQSAAIFMHRPYRRMSANALGIIYMLAMADNDKYCGQIRRLCESGEVPLAELVGEATALVDLAGLVSAGDLVADGHPCANKLLRAFRDTPEHAAVVGGKTTMGQDAMMEVGNIYSAALPAWIAAGLEQAQLDNVDLAGKAVLAIGYGSGDAADSLPLRVVPGWENAARRIGFASALAQPVDLTQEQYETLHDGVAGWSVNSPERCKQFVIESTGEVSPTVKDRLCDVGLDYYAFKTT